MMISNADNIVLIVTVGEGACLRFWAKLLRPYWSEFPLLLRFGWGHDIRHGLRRIFGRNRRWGVV